LTTHMMAEISSQCRRRITKGFWRERFV